MPTDKKHKFLHVEGAVYLKEYKIFFKMNDGTFGIMDFKDELWGEAFAPLKDQDKFRTFALNPITHTIEWETGADVCPDYVKSHLQTITLPISIEQPRL